MTLSEFLHRVLATSVQSNNLSCLRVRKSSVRSSLSDPCVCQSSQMLGIGSSQTKTKCVLHVLTATDIFEVIASIVPSVPILVVDGQAFRPRSNEALGDNGMQSAVSFVSFHIKRGDHHITSPLFANSWFNLFHKKQVAIRRGNIAISFNAMNERIFYMAGHGMRVA